MILCRTGGGAHPPELPTSSRPAVSSVPSGPAEEQDEIGVAHFGLDAELGLNQDSTTAQSFQEAGAHPPELPTFTPARPGPPATPNHGTHATCCLFTRCCLMRFVLRSA